MNFTFSGVGDRLLRLLPPPREPERSRDFLRSPERSRDFLRSRERDLDRFFFFSPRIILCLNLSELSPKVSSKHHLPPLFLIKFFLNVWAKSLFSPLPQDCYNPAEPMEGGGFGR